jgi:hypothetical protein
MTNKSNRPMASIPPSGGNPPPGGTQGGKGRAQAAPSLSDFQKKIIKWVVSVIFIAVLAFLGVTEPKDVVLPPFPQDEAAAIVAQGVTNLSDLTLSGDLSVGDDTTLTDDVSVGGDLAVTGATTISGITTVPINTEHIGLPSVLSTAVTSTTDSEVWTIGDGEIWFVSAVYCHVTTNYDCTGDDCTLNVGIGEDADALLDLDDAELQTTDVDEANGAAGWQGYSADTVGLFMADTGGTVFAPSGAAETIDIAVGGTDPAAGAATCYLVYTRVQ